ncbi:hypothetical protein [Paenibacillus pseudetheri]|nr:hypothetical protein [Paenibacillus pseudetheri]
MLDKKKPYGMDLHTDMAFVAAGYNILMSVVLLTKLVLLRKT